jgi:hypothetical protein
VLAWLRGELLMRTIDEDRVSWIAAQYRCKHCYTVGEPRTSAAASLPFEQEFIKLMAAPSLSIMDVGLWQILLQKSVERGLEA